MYPHKPTILCVDDDPAILDLLEHILVPWGFEVIKATDGQAAIEMVTTRESGPGLTGRYAAGD